MNKKGFTLIEILVAVLIIGILAAIAVPKYQLAVTKSRVASLIPLGRSIIKAEQLYYVEHGKTTTNLDDLDISCPTGTYKYICYIGQQKVVLSGTFLSIEHTKGGPSLYFYLNGSAACLASGNDPSSLPHKVCKSLSQKPNPKTTPITGAVYYELF